MDASDNDKQNLSCLPSDELEKCNGLQMNTSNDLDSWHVCDNFGAEPYPWSSSSNISLDINNITSKDRGNNIIQDTYTSGFSEFRSRTSSQPSLRAASSFEEEIIDLSKKGFSDDLLLRLPMTSSKVGTYHQHRSSLPDTSCLNIRRKLQENAWKKGGSYLSS